MIVERRTFYIKPGSLGKAIELAKESAKFVDVPHGVLLYTHFAGEFNVLMGDVKFENVAELGVLEEMAVPPRRSRVHGEMARSAARKEW